MCAMSEEIQGYRFLNGLYYWRHGHTWAKVEGERVRIGLDSLGVDMAGDVILVRFKGIGGAVEQGKPACTIESAKWAGPVESPISGEIIEVNQGVRRSPRVMRKDPYGEGWLSLVSPSRFEADASNLVTDGSALECFRSEVGQWIEKKKG